LKLAFATFLNQFAIALHLCRQMAHVPISLRAMVAGLLCLMVLICSTLAVSPAGHDALHTHRHQDAHEHDGDAESGHEESTCGVCLFAGGAVDQALPHQIKVPAWTGMIVDDRLVTERRRASSALLAPDGRGPPTRG
jgi:hypothetical protein